MHPFRALWVLLLLAPALAGCLGTAPDADVLTTFYPLQFLTERIAGDNVTVAGLIPEGTEPHDWEPSPRDLRRIDRATLVIAQGLEFEPWLDGAVASLGRGAPAVVHTGEDIDVDDEPWEDHSHGNETDGTSDANDTIAACLSRDTTRPLACTTLADRKTLRQSNDEHGHDHGDEDPHTWLDPVLFAKQAARIRDTLAQTFPEHRAAFFARADILLHDLEGLHESFEVRLDDCQHDVIVVPHDAFSHLAERYGFRVEAVAGLDPEAEPAARRVQEIIDLVRHEGLPIVFAEAGGDDRIMDAIASESGAHLRTLHTLEGRTGDARSAGDDYLDLMRANLDDLADALECGA